MSASTGLATSEVGLQRIVASVERARESRTELFAESPIDTALVGWLSALQKLDIHLVPSLPGSWEAHASYGVLQASFVRRDGARPYVAQLFALASATDYQQDTHASEEREVFNRDPTLRGVHQLIERHPLQLCEESISSSRGFDGLRRPRLEGKAAE